MARRLAFVLQIDPDVFALHAQDNGWTEVEIEENHDEDRPMRLWRIPDGGEVRFVNETALQCQYVEINADPTDPVEAAINEESTCYGRRDWVEALDLTQAEEPVCHGLVRLACTSPGEIDRDVINVTIEGLRDERDNVRIAALKTPIYTKWAEFLPEVTRIAENDHSRAVRGFAGNAKLILELTQRIASES